MAWHRKIRSAAPTGSTSQLLASGVAALVCAGGSMLPAAAGAAEPGPDSPDPRHDATADTLLGTTGATVYDRGGAEAPPELDVAAFLVADLDSGDVLAARDARVALPPAGALQTLTAVTLLPRLDQRALYTVTEADLSEQPGRTRPDRTLELRAGQTYAVDQLFLGMFSTAGADAANALAGASGGPEATAELMNAEADRLGAHDTHVVDPGGGTATGQVSSAYDLALITRAGLDNPDFARYASTGSHAFVPGSGVTGTDLVDGVDDAEPIETTNRLLAEYPGAFGVVHGRTNDAGHTLVGAAEADGTRLVVVVLGAEEPAWDAAGELLDWGFATTASAGDTAPSAVGTLITAEDVERAGGEADRDDPAADRSRLLDPAGHSMDSGDDSTAAAAPSTGSAGAGGAGTAGGDDGDPLARASVTMFSLETLWLWAASALFVVLATIRVRAHFAARDRESA